MKKSLFKIIAALCASLFVFPLLCGCEFLFGKPQTQNPDPEPQGPDYSQLLPVLKSEGGKVVDKDGKEVLLRGINAGGLFVTEHWMTGFVYGSTPSNDYRSLTQTFISRFGEQKTEQLWAEYRANWWTNYDFQTVADMGMNVIRLPFTYMNLDFAAVTSYDNAGQNYDFSALDSFVNTAAQYGIYTILDLHGAYGSHNGQDHSGQIFEKAEDVTFYSNELYISLTEKLWTALAEHYKGHTGVAGYDLLNEPGEKAGTIGEKHWEVYDRLYRAVRKTGDEHVVIFESCWGADNLPPVTKYGWDNCMYSFHHYAGDKLSQSEYFTSWNDKLNSVEAKEFGVPLQMGEFTNYSSSLNWDYVLQLMNKNGWHWTSWTYKVWGGMPWGVINVRGGQDNKVNASEDSYEEIIEKFRLLKSEKCVKYTFSDGKTLESVFTTYCKPKVENKVEE